MATHPVPESQTGCDRGGSQRASATRPDCRYAARGSARGPRPSALHRRTPGAGSRRDRITDGGLALAPLGAAPACRRCNGPRESRAEAVRECVARRDGRVTVLYWCILCAVGYLQYFFFHFRLFHTMRLSEGVSGRWFWLTVCDLFIPLLRVFVRSPADTAIQATGCARIRASHTCWRSRCTVVYRCVCNCVCMRSCHAYGQSVRSKHVRRGWQSCWRIDGLHSGGDLPEVVRYEGPCGQTACVTHHLGQRRISVRTVLLIPVPYSMIVLSGAPLALRYFVNNYYENLAESAHSSGRQQH